ncbi:GtrA family protein [Natrononativus amylolyticus]|uniref:GtrA family protein n=1 Tax=Natrononativus amylolyticus TaxID=2963434 RepID=UPI0020CBD0BD|nr:GtrA family protein [Natrononativus amylolyticus]
MTDSLAAVVRSRLAALRSSERFAQFASVGFVGATVDNAVLVLLVELTVLGPVLAKVIAWELAIAVIFVVNERWTFDSHGKSGSRALGRRFLRSNLVRLAGLLVSLSVLAVLVYGFGVWYLAANVIGIGIGFFVNYTFESLYTWKVHRSGR